MKTYRVGVIPGDGIGPAVVAAAQRVLEALAQAVGTFSFTWQVLDAGADTFRRTGYAIASGDVERIRSSVDATLKGPVGLPDVRHPDGTEAGVLGGVLRQGLDAFANIRPITSSEGEPSPLRSGKLIDYVIVRENTEGLYASRGKGVGDETQFVDELRITRAATERIVREAFAIALTRAGAPADGVSRVTCVDKANVLASYAFFRAVFSEVAEEVLLQHPSITIEFMHADAAAAALVEHPEHFDVIVCENFIGDILSDLGAATVGGLGTCPSANVGDGSAYFEPVHGSAPDLIAQDPLAERADPTAQILAGAMLLDYLGEHHASGRLRAAVRDARAAVMRNERGSEFVLTPLTNEVIARLSQTD
jgi:isocitrate/isopropylmalate dehydrogenase